MTEIYVVKPARIAPIRTQGLMPWLKANLFASAPNALLSTLLMAMLVYVISNALGWGVFNAVFAADPDSCQAARGLGACWGVIHEKGRLIVMGRYPQDEHWRAVLATLLMLSLVVASCMQFFWKPWLVLLWVAVLAAFFILMSGGVLGLSKVDTDQWGGLPLTIMLTVISMTAAFPLAVAVALGRRSNMPAIKSLCVIYVELVRGVPLISVLFMASFMFPLFMPIGKSPDVLIRVIVGITLFAAAYMAEIIRGGLQSLPKGQLEAAASLGLGYWQTQIKIVLPQAMGAVVPSIMNNFISLFKDTSLVTIVSLYELTGALSLAVGSDPNWRPFKVEAYLFIAAIYFICCFSMSRYSLWIEKRLAVGKAS
ncbi:Inner membrane amino-acid ABC transporter permease protein YhdY [Polaromonas vacuolata]|uniref:Inner membrane amino-acid ABC transporter permease protein YhdY n=1 Tax=Polaromonas vacuolata TaxID=37448 RepID=A0A6H2H8D5_9BURK|nr:amino acid ABC transporter permease [Polaromonas vacuolata]QJC56053.1 Inner membrane amino-acid ABC transporter permease protein YhdY [Polaromonas vacuolata]